MERREFLAAVGTAAAVTSASQVFAQTGGGSPQKVNVALWVRLEAKPGKEESVAEFLRQGIGRGRTCDDCLVRRSSRTIQPSPFSTLFPMKPAGKRIWPGKWPPRLMAKAGDLLAQPPAIKLPS